MNDGDILLRAILANPEDDAPRLAYADWLEENGQEERAAFIRVQCEIQSLTNQERELCNSETDWKSCTSCSAVWCPNCGDCSCPCREESMCDESCPLHNTASLHDIVSRIAKLIQELRERAEELFADKWEVFLPHVGGHLREWHFEEFPKGFVPYRPFAFCFRRGFVDEVRCTFANYIQHAPAIAREHPITRWAISDQQLIDMPDYSDGSCYVTFSLYRRGHENAFFESFWGRLVADRATCFPSREAGQTYLAKLFVDMAREWGQKLSVSQ